MADGDRSGGEVVRSDVDGRCPYCGRAVSVRWGDPPDDPGHLLHAQPTCGAFDRMSGDDFVRAVVDGRHKS